MMRTKNELRLEEMDMVNAGFDWSGFYEKTVTKDKNKVKTKYEFLGGLVTFDYTKTQK